MDWINNVYEAWGNYIIGAVILSTVAWRLSLRSRRNKRREMRLSFKRDVDSARAKLEEMQHHSREALDVFNEVSVQFEEMTPPLFWAKIDVCSAAIYEYEFALTGTGVESTDYGLQVASNRWSAWGSRGPSELAGHCLRRYVDDLESADDEAKALLRDAEELDDAQRKLAESMYSLPSEVSAIINKAMAIPEFAQSYEQRQILAEQKAVRSELRSVASAARNATAAARSAEAAARDAEQEARSAGATARSAGASARNATAAAKRASRAANDAKWKTSG